MRRSWLFSFKSSKGYYEIVQHILTNWSASTDKECPETFTVSSQSPIVNSTIQIAFNIDAFNSILKSFEEDAGMIMTQYKHQEGLRICLKLVRKLHTDTPWYPFINSFDDLPHIKFKLPLRFAIIVKKEGGYNFINKDFIWTPERMLSIFQRCIMNCLRVVKD